MDVVYTQSLEFGKRMSHIKQQIFVPYVNKKILKEIHILNIRLQSLSIVYGENYFTKLWQVLDQCRNYFFIDVIKLVKHQFFKIVQFVNEF